MMDRYIFDTIGGLDNFSQLEYFSHFLYTNALKMYVSFLLLFCQTINVEDVAVK